MLAASQTVSYEVLTRSSQERQGKELLTIISICGQRNETGLVPHSVIEQEAFNRRITARRVDNLLRQFVRARILLEERNGQGRSFAIAVPLLRKRLAYHNDSILS